MSDREREGVCEHGTALDVHCCNCHPGFLFSDTDSCVCRCFEPNNADNDNDDDGRIDIIEVLTGENCASPFHPGCNKCEVKE